ncbi:MAG: TetR/AcrR family transcriptional regulator [Rubrivivax sp.]
MAAKSTPRESYHHGDLRSALLDAGLRLLEARTADDLGLRELAREVGVSATAIYRHFPDKGALMSALASEGLERLAQAQRTATRSAGGGKAGFLGSGLAYVRFATQNPALFRLIFSSAPSADPLEASLGSVSAAMRGLRQDIEALTPAGLPAAERKAAALHAWALAHGLAQLVLDKQIPADWKMIERVLARAEPALKIQSS